MKYIFMYGPFLSINIVYHPQISLIIDNTTIHNLLIHQNKYVSAGWHYFTVFTMAPAVIYIYYIFTI